MDKKVTKKEQPVLTFKTQKEWEKWLSQNHDKSDGIWIRFYKKSSNLPTVTYAQALDEALCYGWIDGQAKSLDELSYLQRFTPRRKRSIWSKRNTEHIARLEKIGKMKPAGNLQVEQAKADGRWQAAYESPKNTVVPDDFLKELAKNKNANAFFKTLNKTNTYAIAWQLQSAKRPETRDRRKKKLIAMLARGEKLY
jgi:uncharacterized protein YdeI (YjbR/CyaY-like superfamily)